MLSLVVDAFDLGKTELTFGRWNPFDEEEDRKRLVDPGQWFSKSDAEAFMFQHDALMAPLTDLFAREWVLADLPVELPNLGLGYTLDSVTIHEDIEAHIRALRARAGR
jgi:hypothetical protein